MTMLKSLTMQPEKHFFCGNVTINFDIVLYIYNSTRKIRANFKYTLRSCKQNKELIKLAIHLIDFWGEIQAYELFEIGSS